MVGNKRKQHRGRGGKDLKCNEGEMTEGMKGQEWKKGRKKDWRKSEVEARKKKKGNLMRRMEKREEMGK